MKSLYLLTEDDSDTLFYEACVEKLTGWTFTPVCLRLRKGSGLSGLRASFKIALGTIRRMQAGSGAYFVVAMDNDRAPHARAAQEAMPADHRARLSARDRAKADRYAECLAAIGDQLGADSGRWAVPVAIAVPIEMLESWLLLIAENREGAELPRFSRRDGAQAEQFHAPAPPPPQLKDLCDQAQRDAGEQSYHNWLLRLALEKLNPAELASRSASFALFKQWIDGWRS